MDIFEAIETRRSVRSFSGEAVAEADLERILEAGRLAPSGLNNQPWRFVVVRSGDMIKKISEFSKYGRVISGADALVAVFVNDRASYNRDKDMHGIGACIQNMWLAAHALGVGMCWVGEILARHEEVESALDVPGGNRLMAVLCFGMPDGKDTKKAERLPLDALILGRF